MSKIVITIASKKRDALEAMAKKMNVRNPEQVVNIALSLTAMLVDAIEAGKKIALYDVPTDEVEIINHPVFESIAKNNTRNKKPPKLTVVKVPPD